MRKLLLLSPAGTFTDGDADAGAGERGFRRREMMARHRLVGDDRDLAARPEPGDPLAERREQAAADRDVIGAVAERDIDGDRIAGAQAARSWRGAFRRGAFGRDAAAQAFEDFIDDGFVRHVARFHREVGFGIDRIALLDQPPQRLRPDRRS